MGETDTPRTDAVTIHRDVYRRNGNEPEMAWGFCRMLERELAEMTARAELAERQVAVLCGHIDDYGSCCNCPAKVLGAACSHSGELCRERLAAWSRAEAVKEGGKG